MSGEVQNPASSGTERKSELSWLNLAFCALVVWIHCASQPVSALNRDSWQFFLIYSAQRLSFVSVYGFFFLSGLKLTLPRRPRTLISYWGGRATAILLPYCVSVTAYYLFFTQLLGYFPFSVSGLFGYMLRGDLAAHYYFTVALFQFILLAPLFHWLSRRWSPNLLLPCSLVLTLVCLQYLPDILHLFWPGFTFRYNGISFTTYFFYYLAGCCAGQRYGEFIRMIKNNRGLIVSVFVLSGAFTAYLFWLSATGRCYAPYLEPVHSLYICSGILVCFLIALRLPDRQPVWLARLDRASYLIYLYHCLALTAADGLIRRLGIARLSQTFLLRTLFAFTITPLACVVWQEFYRRVRRRARRASQGEMNV